MEEIGNQFLPSLNITPFFFLAEQGLKRICVGSDSSDKDTAALENGSGQEQDKEMRKETAGGVSKATRVV